MDVMEIVEKDGVTSKTVDELITALVTFIGRHTSAVEPSTKLWVLIAAVCGLHIVHALALLYRSRQDLDQMNSQTAVWMLERGAFASCTSMTAISISVMTGLTIMYPSEDSMVHYCMAVLVYAVMVSMKFSYIVSQDGSLQQATLRLVQLVFILVQVFETSNTHWLLNGGNRICGRMIASLLTQTPQEVAVFSVLYGIAFSCKSLSVARHATLDISQMDAIMPEVMTSVFLTLIAFQQRAWLKQKSEAEARETSASAQQYATSRMLAAFCDARMSLDNELRIVGSPSRVMQILSYDALPSGQNSLDGRSFLKFLDKADRVRFQNVVTSAVTSTKNMKLDKDDSDDSSPKFDICSPPACLQVTLVDAFEQRIPAVLCHVFSLSSGHMLGLREDRAHYEHHFMSSGSGNEKTEVSAEPKASSEVSKAVRVTIRVHRMHSSVCSKHSTKMRLVPYHRYTLSPACARRCQQTAMSGDLRRLQWTGVQVKASESGSRLTAIVFS
eukprot:TRINITY_DN25001_c0_g1_i1.p1 TRINITY_DN25001_c0_g1~~TRINITY_DN25001_c0_g1_i1.p1  ORF type:complete len:513 (+),score=61.64 TRINITY_DN25001_c0_g1_i1:45-1541(+)